MGGKVTYTNEEILTELRAAAQGADRLSQREFEERGEVALTTVRYHFGTWNEAVKAAGLMPYEPEQHRRKVIGDEELLAELIRLRDLLGKPPTEGQLSSKGKYSVRPYRARWGSLKVAYERAILIFSL